MECQEPGCVREATKDWKGQKVCQDHYEYYEERLEKIRRECD